MLPSSTLPGKNLPPGRQNRLESAVRDVPVERPNDPPARCPVCSTPYETVSRHGADDGLVVNLRANRRYARVCFDPLETADGGRVDFYHHRHDDVG
jgi:hypothetical protein